MCASYLAISAGLRADIVAGKSMQNIRRLQRWSVRAGMTGVRRYVERSAYGPQNDSIKLCLHVQIGDKKVLGSWYRGTCELTCFKIHNCAVPTGIGEWGLETNKRVWREALALQPIPFTQPITGRMVIRNWVWSSSHPMILSGYSKP